MKKFKSIQTGIWVTVAFWFLTIVYSPLELYFNNKDEFWFDFYLLFPVMIITFLILELLSMLGLAFCRKNDKVYYGILVITFIAYLSSYIQGTFFSGNLPPLDGTTIVWSEYSQERIKSILIWLIVVMACVCLYRRIKTDRFMKVIKIVSICMTLMLLVTAVTLGIAKEGFEKKKIYFVTTEGELEFSPSENFIILLLDATDARTFSELLSNHPEWKETFQDFTYYEDAMGVYSFTKPSIPFILSGEWYENQMPYPEYLENIYLNSPLFEKLEKQDYKMSIYESYLIWGEACADRFSNVMPSGRKVTSLWDFARWQIQLSGYRYAPFDFKRICFVNPTAFSSLKRLPDNYKVFTDVNKTFYEDITTNEVEISSDKCFKFIHVEGAHLPYRYDKDVNIIDEDKGTYEQNVEAAIRIADVYLNKMRQAGVFDNSVIIVMADHGFEDKNGFKNDFHRSCPLLLIKGKNEQHDFISSAKPISYTDLQEAYDNLLNGVQGEDVFASVKEGPRTRRYLYNEFNKDERLIEYEQKGKARDMDTLLPTGREYIYNGDLRDLDIKQGNLDVQ